MRYDPLSRHHVQRKSLLNCLGKERLLFSFKRYYRLTRERAAHSHGLKLRIECNSDAGAVIGRYNIKRSVR